jgi:hypothetical protein
VATGVAAIPGRDPRNRPGGRGRRASARIRRAEEPLHPAQARAQTPASGRMPRRAASRDSLTRRSPAEPAARRTAKHRTGSGRAGPGRTPHPRNTPAAPQDLGPPGPRRAARSNPHASRAGGFTAAPRQRPAPAVPQKRAQRPRPAARRRRRRRRASTQPPAHGHSRIARTCRGEGGKGACAGSAGGPARAPPSPPTSTGPRTEIAPAAVALPAAARAHRATRARGAGTRIPPASSQG